MGEPVAAVCAATRELARDAAELVEVEYEPLDVLVDAREAAKDEIGPARRRRHEHRLERRLRLGRLWTAAKAEADQVVTIKRAPLPPLQLDAARVLRRRSSSTSSGTGQWTLHCNHQMPGVGAIWMAPALR